MVAASRGLVPILVDCTQQNAHQELKQRYGVRGFPTVLFLDAQGTPVGQLGDRTPAAVKAQLEQVARDHGPPQRPARRPPAGGDAPPADATPSAASPRVRVTDATLEEGLEQARAAGKLLGVIFTPPEEHPRDEQTELVIQSLHARGMDQLPERFHWIRRPLCDDIGMNTPEADVYDCRKAPSVVLFDPWAEAKRGRPFPALLTTGELKDMKAALQRATIEAARAGHPPAAPAEGEGR